MNFEYECGWCGVTNAVWGKPKGFWVELYEVPDEWECWRCEGLNFTPDD